jgi:hypothetical protein
VVTDKRIKLGAAEIRGVAAQIAQCNHRPLARNPEKVGTTFRTRLRAKEQRDTGARLTRFEHIAL